MVCKLGKMLSSRCKFPAIYYKKKVYAIGGYTTVGKELQTFKKTEFYDCVLNKWFPLPELNFKRANASVIVAEGDIVIFNI